LTALDVVPLAPPVDAVYARLRTDLERRGEIIGGNNLWIAAHALALGLTLVTANEREFARITELPRENWLMG
jgi:tRNA(fMet)-specific endonuclease VapC